MIIRMMQKEDIDNCVKIYKRAYAAEPWCEQHTSEEIRDYLLRFISSEGMDSLLLGTVKDYPSHKFYVKNGFREINSSILYSKRTS